MSVRFPHAKDRSYRSFVWWKIAIWIYAPVWLATLLVVWLRLGWPTWMKLGVSVFLAFATPTVGDLLESYDEYRDEGGEPPSESV